MLQQVTAFNQLFFHLFYGEARVVVAEVGLHVVEDVGDLAFVELLKTRHALVVIFAIHDNVARLPVLDDAGQVIAMVFEVVGACQGRDQVAEAAAIVHVAVGAILGIELLSFVLLVSVKAPGQGEQGGYTCSIEQKFSFYQHPSSFWVKASVCRG